MSNKRITELEQQVAHLQWLKGQNERSIKSALERTKVLQQNDVLLKMSSNVQGERASWKSAVIKDELSKPLVLTDEEFFKMEMEAVTNQRKFEKRAEQHLSSASKIKEMISKRMEYNDMARESLMGPLSRISSIESTLDERLQRTQRRSPMNASEMKVTKGVTYPK